MGQLAGPQMHALFARSPNSKGLCGDINDHKAIIRCIKNPKQCKAFLRILPNYRVLYPAIKTIFDLTDYSDVTHWIIASAYWLGSNQALSKVKKHSVEECLRIYTENLQIARVPEEYISSLIKAAPKSGFIPMHLYFVLLISRANGILDIKAVNQCMVSAGIIQKIDQDSSTAEVKVFRIFQNRLGALLLQNEIVTTSYNLTVTPYIKSLEKNALVSIHQGGICTRMTKQSVTGLRIYTERVLGLFNAG